MSKEFDPYDTNTWKSGILDIGSFGNEPSKDDLVSALQLRNIDPADLAKLDVIFPNGMAFNNIKSDDDVSLLVRLAKELNLFSPEDIAKILAGPTPQKIKEEAPPIEPYAQAGGMTITEVSRLFRTSTSQSLDPKTQYEWANYQRKFAEWMEIRSNNKNLPIRAVTRSDISFWILHLQEQTKVSKLDQSVSRAIADRTIQSKYLAALNPMFIKAQDYGAYPLGPIPSAGHKVFTKKNLKKIQDSTKYLPFTNHELAKIFTPSHYLNQSRPADFWLPLLAIFTGGRISELCQLAISDIYQDEGVWIISINDEDYKRLKTFAAKRNVPIHPKLLEIGLLDYVEDAKHFGNMLFPYLTPNSFGNYSETPSERFGDYLDTLNITHPQKVFHSFRSTANDMLKQAGVSEELRCQFVGHEHETTNSRIYANKHSVGYLLEFASGHLKYSMVDFEKFKYIPGKFLHELERLCKNKSSRLRHKIAKEKREIRIKG